MRKLWRRMRRGGTIDLHSQLLREAEAARRSSARPQMHPGYRVPHPMGGGAGISANQIVAGTITADKITAGRI